MLYILIDCLGFNIEGMDTKARCNVISLLGHVENIVQILCGGSIYHKVLHPALPCFLHHLRYYLFHPLKVQVAVCINKLHFEQTMEQHYIAA